MHAVTPAATRLVVTILCLSLAPALRAQAVDPQVIFLQTRIQLLEARVQKQEGDTALLRAELQKALASNAAQIEALKIDDTLKLVQITRLQADVDALKARQPADPAKPAPPSPPGSTPPKPADNQVLSLRAPFSVKDAGGREIFRVDSKGGQPRVFVGDASGGRVELGMSVGGTPAVGLYDSGNTLMSALVGDPKGSYLLVKDNAQSAVLGKYEGTGTGLFLRTGTKTTNELSTDSKGYGSLRIFGADGKAVGGVLAGAEGGSLVLTGVGGGKTIASMAATPSGGRVRVFPPGGGTARAELAADGAKGAVNVFASDGTNVASLTALESKTGKLELNNSTGGLVVEAGATKSGAGYVSTGPYDTGVAASMLSVGKPASSLLGSTKAK
jgi:hypothetical protein